MSMDKIPPLDFDPNAPTKTFSELLAAGVPHKGGLAQLAAAEKTGGLWSAPRKGRVQLNLVASRKKS